jgi:CO/xanthine dehydrogenase Mo-binding subunit
MPAMAAGQFEFVHNVRLPGMLHGQVVRPPTVGATVASVDESSVKDMPGVVKVVVKKNFVGVVAEKPWQAIQAAAKLKVTWTPGPALPPHATSTTTCESEAYSRHAPGRFERCRSEARRGVGHAQGHLPAPVPDAWIDGQFVRGRRRSRRQGHDLVAHARGLVSKKHRRYGARLKPENLRVIFRRGSGCYGLNGADTVTYDAAVLSQAVGKPVRVQLSRKDEMAWENFGNAYVIDERAGLDEKGNIIAWDHESWSPSLGGRPGQGAPGNVVTGSLLGFPPDQLVRGRRRPPREDLTTGATECRLMWRRVRGPSKARVC